MTLSLNRNATRWLIIIASFIIISLILWNTYSFFQKFKAEERLKVQNWSFAHKEINNVTDLNADIGELPLEIISNNTTTPMIVLNDDGSYGINNIDDEIAKDSMEIKRLISKYESENQPIEISYKGKVKSTIYYGNSPLLNKLKYYPLALILIILLFAGVVYFFYRSSKNAEQNKLWTGMAKETAHQIGTPLSSLVGWAEILKSEHVNSDYIQEIEKDISRLQMITDRFSKIGSIPKLETLDIVAETKETYDYLKSRSSKLIEFELILPNDHIQVNLNKQLYSWTIENLVKNAIDAMKGKGKLKLEMLDTEKFVKINVTDNGKGISKSQFSKIFEPGFTSKKRGWGLGLSLAKRIIEDYHNGRIKVLQSEIGKGTTMQISLKKVDL
ncbi:HAMP domain-containing sensor histidine kinase [Ichthyenterobacterium sp. W332]|uniref:histidine kinase n=1 Tax=Microcosmobacter mediterraneus TaxID=3075607 RepID=A0ABU2YK09_9FLAO|nr:HAMP domain-containing sensor histidine kinase [Ichthyenterobacterium sp. W332]MDT0558221.1 HAMP domain-containing sensor histidine kinase [Ichthyenterobacterium sp. W332]